MSEHLLMRFRIIYLTDVQFIALKTKDICEGIGFSKILSSSISVVVSELAGNIFKYSGKGGGEILIKKIVEYKREGVKITAQDTGPGIKNWPEALKEGFSTGKTLGMGLPGVKRLMDEFYYDEKRELGVKIETIKWL
ncbi:MAG: serine/threonine-protein kinase RsbT [Saprospiraceae bacterium]|jgi:serine/threonine-protein kinase RsbT